jgi:Domain of unknown function (DUF5348)
MTQHRQDYRVSGLLCWNTTTTRWHIVDRETRDWELHCGELLEVQIAENWIQTRIEHDGESYYLVTPGLRLQGGLPARKK